MIIELGHMQLIESMNSSVKLDVLSNYAMSRSSPIRWKSGQIHQSRVWRGVSPISAAFAIEWTISILLCRWYFTDCCTIELVTPSYGIIRFLLFEMSYVAWRKTTKKRKISNTVFCRHNKRYALSIIKQRWRYINACEHIILHSAFFAWPCPPSTSNNEPVIWP